MTAPLIGSDENIVGEDVEFFLGFALNILAAGRAEYATN